MENSIKIVKYSGDIVDFNVEKLINSLRRSKANEELIHQIVEQVKAEAADVVEAVKEVAKQSEDVIEAAKGQNKRGRKPKSKK